MTCSQPEARKWIKQNWNYLCESGRLSYAIKRYTKVYHCSTKRSVGNPETSSLREEGYLEIKRELDKLGVDN